LQLAQNRTTSVVQLSNVHPNDHQQTVATSDTTRLLNYSNEVFKAAPIGWWRFGEPSGLVASDRIGSNDGAYFGPVTLGFTGALVANLASETNTAAGDLGSVSYILIPAATNNTFGPAQDFAVEIWFKIAGDGMVVDKASPSTWPYRLAVVGSKLVGSRSDATNTPTVTSAASVNDANWHYALLSKSGSTLSLTLDAVTVTGTDTTSGAVGATANSSDIFVAKVGTTAVDELAIYGAALTAAVGQRHYSAGKGIAVAA